MDRNKLETLKKEYAELVVRSGINLQKGQRLVISCCVECADFARLCASAAYEAGCREVVMNWTDDELTRMKYLKADEEIFSIVNSWEKEFYDVIGKCQESVTIDEDGWGTFRTEGGSVAVWAKQEAAENLIVND